MLRYLAFVSSRKHRFHETNQPSRASVYSSIKKIIMKQYLNKMYADLSKCISDELSIWDLRTKVVAVMRDGGTDIIKALNDSPFFTVPCSAHLLQCVVRIAFLDNPFVRNQLVPKCRKIVSSFKHTNENTKILKHCTNELIAKATIIDPRFKLNPFQQENHSVLLSSIKDSIVGEMEKISVPHGLSPAQKNSVTPSSTLLPQSHTDSSHGVWARYKQLIPSLNVTPHLHTTARDELNHYLNEPTSNPESNPKQLASIAMILNK
ncbi:hypothetical protein PR048_026821 [Dryococelus australis]|uniref:DUF659 domain-containing protein n=1 Tax=Dryococelus australis TaxID=614101 RepID=A0ABQ9GME2_9NEOP|nr:hypothetical protein PR048_026821 [Dryococelus australis]